MPSYDVPTIYTARERDHAWLGLGDREDAAMTFLLKEQFPGVFDCLIEQVPSGQLYFGAPPDGTEQKPARGLGTCDYIAATPETKKASA